MTYRQIFRQYWANKTINYSIRVLLALVGAVIPCWYLEQNTAITPLILGIIAAALAETDDKLSGRLKALFFTFICFAIAAFSIEILFHTPILFAIGLFCSTIAFIMLGALGPRYASIAFGSLLIAIYTMLGAAESPNLWYQPTLLLGGAAWYYTISLTWQIFWPLQPVQQNLATVFETMATYLNSKSELFHPVTNLVPQPYRLQEAKNNAQMVTALNNSKASLLTRAKRGHVVGASDKFLKIYFIAQDIHERVSSSHYRYQDLANTFNRSDILFRFKHLLHSQSLACKEVARCLSLGLPYQHDNASIFALDELQQSLIALKEQQKPEWRLSLIQLDYLFNNLATVERQFANISNPERALETEEDTVLADQGAHTPKAMWQRLRANLTTDSVLFRHAIRMALALTAGYGIIQAFELERGYWILLTTLFVCQPNYSATKEKLVARVAGTLIGLLAGTTLLVLFPSLDSQLVLMVISGVLFFAFRLANYGFATAFITMLVLFCFNQLGEGYAVILPRLGDTLVGCALAVLAVTYILPDWQAKRLDKVMSDTVHAHQDYLSNIISQYRAGKKDSLQYRLSRREAHNSEAALSSAISNMLIEPGKYQTAVDESFRFLCLCHAMLSYISALGAHRMRLKDEETHQLVAESHRIIHAHLNQIQCQLNNTDCSDKLNTVKEESIEKRLSEWRDEDENSIRMVLQQLHLIHQILPEMHTLSASLSTQIHKMKTSAKV
ncbi:YccS family putative transporter [Aliivibrio fischeri]|uniref:Predicted inner membrane protein n=2 Tax=Aliivibrio fischeri TaxID=668 RepID=Q5E4C8_ALIF1|nr:YccS family putative transporter [Aliivibrio fischeri]AAW86118.1 predicted inner membrane protein [Aliivibrio fischeri ES114]KLU79593.1 membrane protein [Aliivibrio fischeri]MBP3142264.1 TIGR01666 family membrane protein [Aliivibrio fischeri]MBP3157109.1 TIGR01666 family membrane protein [Aliivibrio fischeri]MCE7537738.1 YccS family putative transporter [Aliivibrio fischeri]